jgi:hypothetical protein
MNKPACKFCQKETVYVPLRVRGGLSDHDHGTDPGRKIDAYYCYDCQAEYVDWGNIKNVHLYTTINSRMYRWSVEMNGTMGRLWHVGEPGIPGQRFNRNLELIKNFKEHYPQINPQNINRKLKFILLFL